MRVRQDGDSTQRIQQAIDSCPVDCIHWVNYEKLEELRKYLESSSFKHWALPPPASGDALNN